MNLSPEERKIGKDNFNEAVGTLSRRELLKGAILAGAGTGVGLGAAYFGYDPKIDDRLRVGIIGTGDEGGVLIGALNPDFIDVVAIADIRPYSIHRAFYGDWYSDGAHAARPGLLEVYKRDGWADAEAAEKHIKVYLDDYQKMLDDAELDIEAVIIALPLHLHHEAAIAAMRSGKHVLTEKLMAHNVAECKEMARVAQETGLILAVGHQRHYSILYDNAVDQIRQGLIGDIHHIRAQWHRANLPGKDSWQPPLPEPTDYPLREFELALRELGGDKIKQRALVEAHPLYAQLRSWNGRLNAAIKAGIATDIDLWQNRVDQTKAQLEDIVVDAANYGYESKTLPGGYQRSALEELIRWRLWNRTGGGLMAELGSHQLDAASIFISAQRKDGHKVKPLSVTGVGGRHIFPADRECEDHVYCTFEFPGIGYFKGEDTHEVADSNKKIVVAYSSINGNGFGGYGEVVFGTEGTLILEREQDAMLFKGSNTTTRVSVKASDGKAAMDTYETGGGAAVAQAAMPTDVSRGYREEIEHWAWCIKNPDPAHQVRCTPEVALADAVIALTSNLAIAKGGRIDFRPEWFDVNRDETPEGSRPRSAADSRRGRVASRR
jgi:predicted dehydrogenase